ncbi:hypothetical protein APUTEX25_004599 [Auxenochlorella protothecoides]|uniref:Uncharacterized protein n=1 Tax=Auxenochlorella protothecoides TaxID=3075 RepID=A0A3M7L2F5_AUXPR|nr:hypothetical protein APUTEX25_004599 [Auxenochlorella protothecoides]|eukprot:RMZ56175.1 hypothetical protein APUTEX25_004599 [Auxenochlorella protothecoides]
MASWVPLPPSQALRPPGVALLVVVVRVFAGVRDPLAEGGEPLLGQYEAQLVSAIRTSLAPEAGADLRAAGAALGAAFGPAQCCEREAAYIMLGALGTLARPDIMLWAPALDTQAADALVELMAGGGRQSQAQEAAAVAELTWRAAAAEALLPLLLREEDERQGPAPPANGRAPVPAGATFLAPTLGALCREPTLADPLRCRSARVAAAVALLQTRVLGALRRPADLPPSAQEALSTLCLRGLRSVVAAAAAGGGGGGPGSSTLEAAVLAPWLDPFDDVLEDEDSGDAFIGAAGAPQATAWELGLRGAIPCLDRWNLCFDSHP